MTLIIWCSDLLILFDLNDYFVSKHITTHNIFIFLIFIATIDNMNNLMLQMILEGIIIIF